MSPSTHNETIPNGMIQVADEFASWPMTQSGEEAANFIRVKFHDLLSTIAMNTPPQNARYLALVKTKLEEASFFAIKGVAKPTPT
jgi:hypothetical protein